MPSTQSWYEIKAAADRATVRIYNEIGIFGVTAEMFARELDAIDAPLIDLQINSPGGAVDESKAIYNSLLRHPAQVRGTVDGMAASSASFILQAADERIMADGATMMVHGPWLVAIGNKATLEKAMAYLDVETDAVAEIYAQRSGKSAEQWRETMQSEVWYRSQDAVDAGLADKVASVKAQNFTAFNLARFQNVPEWAKPIEEPPSPVVFDADHGWPLLAHHGPTGAVTPEQLRVALARARNLSIPVDDRVAAIRHLEGHAAVARLAA